MKPDGTSATIVIEQCACVRGIVQDPNGQPVNGATVAPAKSGSGNSLTGDTRFSVQTRDDGTFVSYLPASNLATYNLVAHDGKHREWRTWANGFTAPFQSVPGQEIINVVIQLHNPATVRGIVTDEAGSPKKNIKVRASAKDKLDNRYYVPETKTVEDGSFELKFIHPGLQIINCEPYWINAEDSPPGTFVVLDIKEAETTTGVVLRSKPNPR
jgi:hypothetical protein